MALLDLHRLTVRFGGLTAVNQLDLTVEPGQIFALIGPNGAGKTTVFNAITGLGTPSDGTVHFEGRNLRRPFHWRVLIASLLVGLITGIATALFTVNIDSLWRAVIVLNATDPGEPFPFRQACRDGLTFIKAGIIAERRQNRLTELDIYPRGDQFAISSRDRKIPLEICADEETALRRLETVTALVSLGGSTRTTRSASNLWLVVTSAGDYLGVHNTAAAAQQQAENLRALPTASLVENASGCALVNDGRQIANFDQRYEAEDFQSAMAFAQDAHVQPGDGLWLTSDDNQRTVLATFPSREQARTRLLQLAIDSGKLKWRLTTRASPATLGFALTPTEADATIRQLQTSIDRGETPELAALGKAQRMARASVWVALFLGFTLGAGGSLTVWNRARSTTDYITRQGIARTFQNIRLFPKMLAIENVLLGLDAQHPIGIWSVVLKLRSARRAEEAARRKAAEILAFVGLEDQADKVASSMAYGDQRRLEIARALATGPRLLLLDEPAAGMNPSETMELMRLIRRIRDTGITVLLIEHDMQVVMGISHHIAVLQDGAKIAEGTPAQIQNNPRVIEAYLGRAEVTT